MSDSSLIPRSMSIEEFLPLKGRTFLADCNPKPAALDLVEVEAGRQLPGATRECFTLIFRSSPDILLVPAMYRMKTDGFGPEIIYIERTNPPADPSAPAGIYYQAVFN